MDIVPWLDEEPQLKARSWKDVKNYAHNFLTAQRKKLKAKK